MLGPLRFKKDKDRHCMESLTWDFVLAATNLRVLKTLHLLMNCPSVLCMVVGVGGADLRC